VPDSDDYPLTSTELAFLKELSSLKVRYLIVGMGAAVLQGADAVTKDLDLWFESTTDSRIAEAAKAVGGVYVWRSDPPMLAGADLNHIDIVYHCHGLRSFKEEYSESFRSSLRTVSVKILPLERVIASKIAANRTKDRAVIPALRAALKAQGK
jgi:hypothetical protein